MATFSFASDDGALPSASAVVEIKATNPEYNQPALRVHQQGRSGGAASIRIDDPNPDIEFVETGLADREAAAGKFEIAVQSDILQLNGRASEHDAHRFETIAAFQRPASGGNMGIGFRAASQFAGFGDGQGAVVIASTSRPPSRTVAGAGILYVHNGALMYRGARGTVTQIAPA